MNKQSLLLRNRILLTYFSFVISCIVVIVAFMTATTYIQLAVAILLYPVLVFFTYKILPDKWKHTKLPLQELSPNSTKPEKQEMPTDKQVEISKVENVGISDIDKRVFLKLIGSAGIFLFIFSIFNKKAEGLFFKSLPGSVSGKISLEDIAGNKIDPAQNQPTDGYRISEIDNNNSITYYGFTNKDGAWFVMMADTDTGSFRYSRGNSNFPNSWTNRENLKYDYYANIF